MLKRFPVFGVRVHRKLICLAYLSFRNISVPFYQTLQCTQISQWLESVSLPATALNSIIVNQDHMVFLAWLPLPCPPPSPLHAAPHTHSPFLSVSLQIRAAEVRCYFIQDRLATEDGFLWMGPYYELETQGHFFLIECFNTSYKETAGLQIKMFSVAMINVLFGVRGRHKNF